MALQEWQQARLSRDRRFDGRFFVAVKSTGIFCRNVCPARLPKEQNVEYFEQATRALQEGYRPCLRCRPDSAPNSFAWLGVETTLVRAMRLLKEDPEAPLQAIAERLGISDGYLRKLFRQRLGISPKQYQLGEQLLFAKKLLHETAMSVEQVALSVGFQSARRLQENLKHTLNLSATQIRQQHRATSETQQPEMEIYLSYRPPYHWQQVREFLARRAIEHTEWVTEQSYSRTFTWGDCNGFFIASIEPDKYRFKVTLSVDKYHNLRAVLGNIRRILDLETDYQVVKAGLLQAGLQENQITEGLRLPGVWSLFEAGCRAILGQQVSVKAAINHVSNLAQHLGECVTVQQQERLRFPTPNAVADSDLSFFRMPQARKNALIAFARFMVETPDADPENWLAIKGIGPWTVAYAQMRGQSNPNIWLETDLVIKQQMQKFALQPAGAAPWRSYLTFQLWGHA